jgi:4-amino-4-deoxy-L-arabinose transferase-like glycosyltransferase
MNHVAIVFILMAMFTLVNQFLQDIKTFHVSEKRNWIMIGAVYAMALSNNLVWEMIFLTAGWGILLYVLQKARINVSDGFGDGDQEILAWVIPGTILLGQNGDFHYTIWFLAFLLIAYIGLMGWTKLTKDNNKKPGTVLLLLCFLGILDLILFGF